MSRTYRVRPSQIVDLRNNMIIAEALEEEQIDVSADTQNYDNFAIQSNQQKVDKTVTQTEKSESEIYGIITKLLYEYAKNRNLPNVIASEIEKQDNSISMPTASDFIEKLLYGLYRMADNPELNISFERLLRNIGVTVTGKLLTKDNTLN